MDVTAVNFKLPDLRPVLGDWVSQILHQERHGYYLAVHTALSFTHLNIWQNVRLQQYLSQDDWVHTPEQTVQALPPSVEITHGCIRKKYLSFTGL